MKSGKLQVSDNHNSSAITIRYSPPPKMSVEATFEILTTVTSEQRLVTPDGLVLVEKKKLTTVADKDDQDEVPKLAKHSDLIQERRIGDQKFVVREVLEYGKVVKQTETCLPSRNDMQNFKSLWLKFWDPTLSAILK